VRTVEDRHDEAWVDRVHDMTALVFADQRGHRVGLGSIDLRGNEAILAWVPLLDRCNRSLGSREVVVGDHESLEEIPTCRDPGKRVAHPSRADKNHPHV
jgi:hypothetical protein